MITASIEEIAEFDEEGTVTGFQFEGRQRAIQEWRDKKEAEEYEQLFSRLYSRNHARKARATQDGRERVLENQRRHRNANREKLREREFARRKEKYDADPVVNTCIECGHVWIPPYEQSVKRSKFCSRKCRNKHASRDRVKRRNRGIRNMDIRSAVLSVLAGHPEGLTSEKIACKAKAKVGSTRTLLCQMAKSGEVIQLGGKGRAPAKYFPKEKEAVA